MKKQLYDLHIDWDEQKARSNWRKHKISFDHAATVFQDPLLTTIFDDDNSTPDEERWVTLGKAEGEVLVVVVHTYNDEVAHAIRIRIISARRATTHERQQYEVNA